MNLLTLNINEIVKVKLTERGEICASAEMRYSSEREADSEGYTRWQLWRLMQVFGHHISMGQDPVFESNKIAIPEDSLD